MPKQEPKVDLQACGLPDFSNWDFIKDALKGGMFMIDK